MFVDCPAYDWVRDKVIRRGSPVEGTGSARAAVLCAQWPGNPFRSRRPINLKGAISRDGCGGFLSYTHSLSKFDIDADVEKCRRVRRTHAKPR